MGSLIDLLRHRASRSPDSVALIAGARQVSYTELDRASDLAARRLAAAGTRPGDLIGLLVARNAETIIALLAILKCGAAYVPIDPEYPHKRISFIAEDSKAKYVIGNASVAQSAGLLDDRFLDEDTLKQHFAARPPAQASQLPASGASDVAYVIYTSGSTGLPKGCLITHGNVLALLDSTLPLFSFLSTDRWSLFHSLCFDFSVWELWGAWATGATVVVVPWRIASSPVEFVDFLIEHKITVLNQVPSVFRYTSQEIGRRSYPELALRQVIFGGESVSLADVKTFVDGAGAAAPTLVNMYGITENTVHSTFKELDKEALSSDSLSPIGRPLPHVGAHILDEERRPVADGDPGNLWLSGPSLSQGYLARDELTRERFVELILDSGGDATRCYRTGDVARRLPDGDLEYLGREDDQVKIRGFRVELPEIEAALNSHETVADSAVATLSTNAGPTLIACVVCTEPYSDTLEKSIIGHLSASLPAYMVPRFLRPVDQVPLMPSGKRDRSAIAGLFHS